MTTPSLAQSFGGPSGTGAMPMSFADMWPSLVLVALLVWFLWLAASRHSR